MNANKVNPENLVAVRLLWEIHLYKLIDGPITALQTLDCDWSVHKFIFLQVNGQQPNFQEWLWLHSLSPLQNIISNCWVKIFAHYDFLEINSLYNYLLYCGTSVQLLISNIRNSVSGTSVQSLNSNIWNSVSGTSVQSLNSNIWNSVSGTSVQSLISNINSHLLN